MPLLALLLIFIVLPLTELYLIFKVSDGIGWLPTIAILAADSVLGAVLLKSQGRTVWRRFTEVVAQHRVPHREVLDGALVIFGGALLLTPGFLTDFTGLLLLVPPTRAVVRRALVRSIGGGWMTAMAGAAARRRGGRGRYDVEGTATEVRQDPAESEPPRLPR